MSHTCLTDVWHLDVFTLAAAWSPPCISSTAKTEPSPWWRHQMETFSALLHRSPANSPHKGQWRQALMFSLMRAWTNGRVNNRNASNLRRRRGHYDAAVMSIDPLHLLKGCKRSIGLSWRRHDISRHKGLVFSLLSARTSWSAEGRVGDGTKSPAAHLTSL